QEYKYGAVVFFADDDNAYDVRLFDKYIRRVKRLGMWGVSLAGAAVVEAPRVANNTIVGWDAAWKPERKFAIDLAGFAVNLKEIMRVPNEQFGLKASSTLKETLKIVILSERRSRTFGYLDNPKEVLAWHVRTKSAPTQAN
ncbi:hypothetical protein PENTCL1PPCAC_13089, partial [Pristionchus entomophagus]